MTKQISKSDPAVYTKPTLRDRIKARITAGDKGGKADQWSARKAQLVAQEYEREGGGYKGKRGEPQKSLKSWGDEHWQTAKGDARARQEDGTTARYLPEKAWDELSASAKKALNDKKREGSRRGLQFVRNTVKAAAARKKTTR